MTGPQPLPKPVLHRAPPSVPSFNFQYHLVSLTSSGSCWPLLYRLPVTSLLPTLFPPITCFRRQFLHKMWRIQLVFLLFIVCRIFLPPPWLFVILLHFSHDLSKWSSPAPHFKNFQVFLICSPKPTSFSTVKTSAQNLTFYWFVPQI